MISPTYCVPSLACIAILIFALIINDFYANPKRRSGTFRFFLNLLLLFGAISTMAGYTSSFPLLATRYLIQLMNVKHILFLLMGFAWFLFIVDYCKLGLFDKYGLKFYVSSFLPSLIVFLIIYVNSAKGFIYYINANYVLEYTTSYLSIIIVLMITFYPLGAIIAILFSGKSAIHNSKGQQITLITFTITPIIFSHLENKFPSFPLSLLGLTSIAILILLYDALIDREILSNELNERRQKEVLTHCLPLFERNGTSNENIYTLLKNIAIYYNADKAIVFQYNSVQQTVSVTYEWYSGMATPLNANLQNIKIKEHSLIHYLEENGTSYFNKEICATSQNETLKHLSTLLDKYNTEGIFATPIMSGGELLGSIAISNPQSHLNDFTTIRTISALIYSEIQRRVAGEFDDSTPKVTF